MVNPRPRSAPARDRAWNAVNACMRAKVSALGSSGIQFHHGNETKFSAKATGSEHRRAGKIRRVPKENRRPKAAAISTAGVEPACTRVHSSLRPGSSLVHSSRVHSSRSPKPFGIADKVDPAGIDPARGKRRVACPVTPSHKAQLSSFQTGAQVAAACLQAPLFSAVST